MSAGVGSRALICVLLKVSSGGAATSGRDKHIQFLNEGAWRRVERPALVCPACPPTDSGRVVGNREVLEVGHVPP